MKLRKAKGIKQSVAMHRMPSDHFQKVTMEQMESHKAIQTSLKRHKFEMFLIQTRKTLLSYGTTKRIFYDEMRRANYHFSVPIHFKQFVTPATTTTTTTMTTTTTTATPTVTTTTTMTD